MLPKIKNVKMLECGSKKKGKKKKKTTSISDGFIYLTGFVMRFYTESLFVV